MTETRYVDQEEYDKLYQKLEDIHEEINRWAFKLEIIVQEICGHEKFLGMYELGVLQQKIRRREEEIQENWLNKDEEDGQED